MKFDCLTEVDIRTKALSDDRDDRTLVDGCLDLTEGRASFNMLSRIKMEGGHRALAFNLIMFRKSVEATIHMISFEVPGTSMHMRFGLRQSIMLTTSGKISKQIIDIYAFEVLLTLLTA